MFGYYIINSFYYIVTKHFNLPKMETVTLIVNDKQYVVPKNKIKNTLLFGSMFDTFTYHDTKIQLPISSTELTSEAIKNYIDFIDDSKSERRRKKLKSCLQLCSLIGDFDYLRYCVETQLLRHYSYYKSILDELNDNLKYDMYLFFPFSLIPESLTNNEAFFLQWAKTVSNEDLKVDDDVYLQCVEYWANGKVGRVNCWLNNKCLLSRRYWSNGHKRGDISFCNGVQHGVSRDWYKNGQLQYKSWYDNGKLEQRYSCNEKGEKLLS